MNFVPRQLGLVLVSAATRTPTMYALGNVSIPFTDG